MRKPKNFVELQQLLKVPEDDKNRLEAVLPDSITANYGKSGLTFELSNWIRKILFSKPGFLFDSLWAATLLGVREDSFNKIEKYFTDALYNGIYVNEIQKRWWQSKLKDILFTKFTDSDEFITLRLADKFDEIEKSDFSICKVCKERYPETVAYTDEELGKRVQVHLKCSIPSKKAQKKLFFEEIRVIKEL